MRRLPLLIFLLLISLQAFSQKEMAKNLPAFDLKRLHFGFTIGINTMDVALDRNYAATDFVYADLTRLQPGFQVTVVSDLRLSQNWNLRFLPGISFGAREISYYDFDANTGTPPTTSEAIHTVPLSAGFLEFPLLFKYRSQRVNNYRPYLVAGLNYRYDMIAKKKGAGYDEATNEYARLLPGDLYVEFGFGLDNYLKYFKFAPEIKVAMGLRNILNAGGDPNHIEYTASVSRARSFIVMLNFHFE